MRKKKKLLNLALLLSLGVGSFGPNVNLVFAEEPGDEIILEDDESQITEELEQNAGGEELELEIPDSEESSDSISLDAEEKDNEIQAVTVSEKIENTANNENESSNQPVFYSNAGFEIKNGVLVKYNGTAATVKIPNSVKVIGEMAFYENTNLKNISLPSSVQELKNSAFSGCSNLQSINLTNIKTIGAFAFIGCSNLQSISLENVKNIGQNAFYGCTSISSIYIPSTLTKIELNAFSDCTGLKNLTIASGCTIIGEQAFMNCSNMKSVILPSTIEEIERFAFSGCRRLQSIIIPDSVTDIQRNAFANCNALKDVQLPKNLKAIGLEAFQNTALESITIPDEVISIGAGAFSNISALKSVYLPYKVSFLGDKKMMYGYEQTLSIFANSPNVCLNLYSDHQYAIDYAKKHNITWKSRGLYNVQKPKTVKAESVGKNKVRLSWSKASGADKYLVQCWRNGKLQYKYTTKNNYLTDPKASDTTSNTYKVYSRMSRSDGMVVYSSQPAVNSALGICPKVTNVRANSTTSGAQIKWNKSYYNDGYIIYRSINKNGTGAVYAGTTRDVKFTDKKAKKGQLYYYWVYPYHNKNGKMILGEKPAESPRAKMK